MRRIFTSTYISVCVYAIIMASIPLFVFAQNAPEKNAKAETAVQDSVKAENPLEYSRPVLDYESEGKRDPFESLAPEIEEEGPKLKGLFNYEEATLNGIVATDDDVYALLADKAGLGYVLRKGYRVFGGYVTDITEDAVHFHIVKYGRSLTIIMRFSSSKTTIVEEIGQDEMSIQRPGIIVQYKKSDAADAEDSKVLIEDVVLPSLDTKTIDRTWFGADGGASESESAEESGENAKVQRFSLIDPPSGSIVTLPYLLDWTTLEGDEWSYSVIIDDNPDYSSPLLLKDGIAITSFIIDNEAKLPTGIELFWKVLAKHVSGEEAVCRRTDMRFTIR